jgi:hypothetical protein
MRNAFEYHENLISRIPVRLVNFRLNFAHKKSGMSYSCVPEVIHHSFHKYAKKLHIIYLYLLKQSRRPRYLLIQRGDIILSDWGVAASALGRKLLKVAHLYEEH